jgi:HD-like signal output (HDOD) protein
VASAFAAEALTKQSGRAIPAEAFMAALLHDFGVPVQERLDSAGVVKLMEALAANPDAPFRQLEDSLVQVDHARCAEVVFDNWHLPQGIVCAARYHDAPLQAPGPARQLTTLVHLGVQLALQAGFTHPLEPREQHEARESLLRLVGLTESITEPIVAGLSERVLLVVETPTPG